MALSQLPPFLSAAFASFAYWLDRRTQVRLPLLLSGILLANGRRTATSWFRAAGITYEFRRAYNAIGSVGHNAPYLGLSAWQTIKPCLAKAKRLLFGIDDSPTKRYGPCVEGAGIHHNPTPGPAGEKYLYGHVWVTLAALAKHKDWGTIALPLLAELYVRQKDVPLLPPERHWSFRTKLELGGALLAWIRPWAQGHAEELWVAVDGGYAKKPFLKAARQEGFTVVGRLRKDAALWSLPPTKRPKGKPGPMPTYGKRRISLAKRAGQRRGWQQVECLQYGCKVTKTVKTFLATYKPAGGLIRVVIVKEEDDWIPFFCTDPDATVEEVLEAAADRGSIEQTFKDVKEVWGAGQQQLRNIHANVGAFNLNLWMHSLTEAWAWDKPFGELVDRSASPWDSEPRRPSHADKRKSLQRQALREEIQQALDGDPDPERFRELAERLLQLAA
jgi:hypothetical protein